MKFIDSPIVDCHVHFENVENADLILSIMKEANFKRMNLVSVISSTRVNFNPEEMYMKAAYPEAFYIFGALDYSSVLRDLGKVEPSLTKQVDTLIDIGFDGIKMIEGKPTVRKLLNIPFDSQFYKDYFKYLESLQYPILFHVNDPEEYWDPEQVPPWAKQKGWCYDETYPTREKLYKEIENLLENCPNLKVIFAHFYFMSGDMERVSQLLDSYKNVYLDITPGPSMYYNFSAKREDWRTFFIQYQDRIIYGTDINDKMTLENAVNLANRVRKLLETDEPVIWRAYPKKKEPLIGLKLPAHVLKKIYAENFEKMVGSKPKTINLEAAIKECDRLAKAIAKCKRAEDTAPSTELENPAEHVKSLLKSIKDKT